MLPLTDGSQFLPLALESGSIHAAVLWKRQPGRATVGFIPRVRPKSSALSPQHEQLNETIQQIRDEVSDRDWKFFWRVVVDGQSAADVGREFGVTANTVRLVKMRLLRKLRRNLGTQQSIRKHE